MWILQDVVTALALAGCTPAEAGCGDLGIGPCCIPKRQLQEWWAALDVPAGWTDRNRAFKEFQAKQIKPLTIKPLSPTTAMLQNQCFCNSNYFMNITPQVNTLCFPIHQNLCPCHIFVTRQ